MTGGLRIEHRSGQVLIYHGLSDADAFVIGQRFSPETVARLTHPFCTPATCGLCGSIATTWQGLAAAVDAARSSGAVHVVSQQRPDPALVPTTVIRSTRQS